MSNYTSSIIVTGGTNGMGYHCSYAIAKQCPNTLVVIASRTEPSNAAASINSSLSQSNVKYMSLDLSTLSKVRDFASRWTAARYPPIQALVLNAAGQWPGSIEYTDDGIEKNFGVNHVGHALLVHLLVPKLTADARIAIVSSGVHDPDMKWDLKPDWTTSEEVARPSRESEKKSNGMDRYATSKVANALWMLALSRHLSSPAHANKTVVAFDPGLMPGTGLMRNSPAFLRFLVAHIMPRIVPLMRLVYHKNIHLPQESGESLAWLAVGDEVKGKKGIYYEGRQIQKVSDVAGKEEVQEELFQWTVQRVAEGKEERERFARLE